ncbi:helix-turn-helix domain-containing protein [Blastococcus tunisiensis]|uniref:AraC-type DNA-binding protein n=1 Tax=Blastococcus tunisiensis TaxID=1798228 RepID=A0A1I2KWL1_9ACTN|nr:helix-turn-helix domain-containing protein [Blastococcus sp. DSM 46838]SFF71462.1 AraC-type DNA-binding protein [Blastococcus sp. DSM 46838]
MVTLLDTDRLDPAGRRPARVAERLEAALVSRIHFADPREPARARLDAWDLGGISVLRLELSGELTLSRSRRQIGADAAPTVSFAVQERGVALHEHLGRQRVVPRGGLAVTEVASPYGYHCSGPGICRAVQVPVGRLGLPVDVVRRALPRIHRSPLFGLVRGHLEHLSRDAQLLATDPTAPSVAGATVDLVRALLASAGATGRSVDDVVEETLLTQVRGYVRRHLTEPGLDVEQIAAAHAISVRQLYRLCAAAGFSLEQWMIHQRLEGARRDLSDLAHRDRSIAVVARRWGFTDASYFSRRFRQAFGTTPREWRHAASPRGPVARKLRNRRPDVGERAVTPTHP